MTPTEHLEAAKKISSRRRYTYDAEFEMQMGILHALIAIAEVALTPPKQYVINTHNIEDL
ncbi:hypothetical protein SEA_SUPERCHUNK_43 [Mycobacterium phage Superchunk]|nr:hypothetical protein SEA_SUPERCHUNK_43 [Mycobacterium phage Superchunk]